jgi:hypothetical protein
MESEKVPYATGVIVRTGHLKVKTSSRFHGAGFPLFDGES